MPKTPAPLDYRNPAGPADRPRCATCGSDLTVEGTLYPVLSFRPNKLRKRFSLASIVRVVEVDAVACTACGAVNLRIDREKLIKMAGDPGGGDGGAPPAT